MPRVSAYTKYISDKTEDEINKLNDTVKEMYIDKNMTREEISELLGIDFNVIRGITSKLKKPKSLKYARIAENSAKTNIEKYGTKCTLNTEESIRKKRQTWINNYGVNNPSKADEVKSKKVETSQKHYGTDYPLQSEEIKEHIDNTNLRKYGVKRPLRNSEIIGKVKSTNLNKYGVENAFQIQHSIDKAKESLRSHIPDDVKSILYNKDKFIQLLSSFEFKDRTWYNVCSKLGLSTSTVGRIYRKYNISDIVPINVVSSRSHYEDDIISFIRTLYNGYISKNNRNVIHPFEIDIYIPEFKLGIEFNGDYWHSDEKKESQYHQKKSMYAKDKGIFIYHIWEHEWNDPIKQKIIKSQIQNLLHCNDVIYARKCEVREISSSNLREFLDENHLQGNRNSSIRYGLFYNNELVSVMSFGFNKFIRKNSNDIELLRFCNKCGLSIVGGASKLFKRFLNDTDYDNIISYCNIAKGKGNLYYNLGFEFESITPCNYKWINIHTGEIKSRYQCQMKDEFNIMISKGFTRIEDCGSYKFIYRRNH